MMHRLDRWTDLNIDMLYERHKNKLEKQNLIRSARGEALHDK